MEKTGVFASKEQLEEVKIIFDRRYKPREPVICFSMKQGIERENAPRDAQKLCHKYALKNNLPEMEGYYGIDLETGEFVKKS